MNIQKVIIIWAWPAWLTTAFELAKTWNFDITVLEMSNVIWGLSQTYKHGWNKIDIWGHRFFSKSDEVMDRRFEQMPAQWKEASDYKKLGIKVELRPWWPDPEKEDLVFLRRNRLSRLLFWWNFFDYPPSLNFSNLKNLWIIRIIQIVFSYLYSKFETYDESHLEWFYKRKFWNKLYTLFFKNYTKKLWWKDPSDIDSSRWAQRVKWVSITKLFKSIFSSFNPFQNKNDMKKVETSLISQFRYPKFWPGHMRETVAENCKKLWVQIIFDAKVIKIEQTNGRINGVIYISDHKEHKLNCDVLVSTMPIKYLMRWMQEAPYDLVSYAEKLEYRDFITVWVLLDKMLLKNTTTVATVHWWIPDNWIYIHDENADYLRIQFFNNRSPYMLEDQKKFWIGLEYICSKWDFIWSKSDDELKKSGIEQLEKIWIANWADVLDSVVIRMEKAYPAYFGDWFDHFPEIQAYINSIGNLYCIGRNGMHRYNNQDHSVLCWLECAKKICWWIEDKTDLWLINTEKEYHEQK